MSAVWPVPMNLSQTFPDGYDTYIEQGGNECIRWSETATLYSKSTFEEAEDPDS